jgi:hypothetical protein
MHSNYHSTPETVGVAQSFPSWEDLEVIDLSEQEEAAETIVPENKHYHCAMAVKAAAESLL